MVSKDLFHSEIKRLENLFYSEIKRLEAEIKRVESSIKPKSNKWKVPLNKWKVPYKVKSTIGKFIKTTRNSLAYRSCVVSIATIISSVWAIMDFMVEHLK